jgi:hypothetical protein
MKNRAILALLIVLDGIATLLFPVVLLAALGFEIFGLFGVFLGTREIYEVSKAHSDYATVTTMITAVGCFLHVFVLLLSTKNEQLEYLPLWSRLFFSWLNRSHRLGS